MGRRAFSDPCADCGLVAFIRYILFALVCEGGARVRTCPVSQHLASGRLWHPAGPTSPTGIEVLLAHPEATPQLLSATEALDAQG